VELGSRIVIVAVEKGVPDKERREPGVGVCSHPAARVMNRFDMISSLPIEVRHDVHGLLDDIVSKSPQYSYPLAFGARYSILDAKEPQASSVMQGVSWVIEFALG